MTKMLLPGICLGSLILVLAGCAEPPQLMEEGEKSVTNFTLRPQQSYILSYTEESFTFEARVKYGMLGKTSDDFEAVPILSNYEKTTNTEKWDSTGEFFFDKSFIDGTYEGNIYSPSKMGKPGEGETQKSQNSIDNEVVRMVSDKRRIRITTRNGSTTLIPTPNEIETIIQQVKEFNIPFIDTSGTDTTGLYGRNLDLFNEYAKKTGASFKVLGNNVVSFATQPDANRGFIHSLIDMKTGNTIQDAYYENGEITLFTKYNYVLRGNRYFQSTIHTRLFETKNGKPEVISETLQVRKNIRVTPL